MNIFNVVVERYKNDINGNARIKASFFYNGNSCNRLINKGKTINHGLLMSSYTFNDLDKKYYTKILKDNNMDIKGLKIVKLELN